VSLSFNERQGSQVFPVQKKQIEGDEHARGFSEYQILEYRPAFAGGHIKKRWWPWL
jgi:hypothetical protein